MSRILSIVPFRPGHAQAWDRIVENSRNGLFLHFRSFMDYHADRFDDASVLVMENDIPVAVFPANRIEGRIISHGGLTFGGLIYGMDRRATQVRDAIFALCDHYHQQGASSLYYKAVPHVFQKYPAEEDIYALYLRDARLVRRDLSCVLRLAERPKYSALRSRCIARAKKAGIKIRDAVPVAAFHTLLSDVLKRHGASPVHSIFEIELLSSRFANEISIWGSYIGDELLAVALLFKFKHVIHTQYLASSEQGKKSGALDLLLSNLMETMPPDVEFFSFGASTESDGRILNEGLMFQKEGFGGRGIVLDHYELEL